MTLLLDTHFLIWILLGTPRLKKYPWIDNYRPWGISPISFLEMQFLAEAGRLELDAHELIGALAEDARFLMDDPPFSAIVRHAVPLAWTRDPFDRMLAGHSFARRLPLCTLDQAMRRHHPLIPAELTRESEGDAAE